MAAPSGSTYELARPTGVCASTGRAIEVGERFVATLAESEPGGPLERADYTIEAWERGARPEAPRRLIGTWRSELPAPDAPKRAFVGNEELLDLFEQLEDAQEPERIAFRYILTLLLVRKRLLKVLRTRGGVMVVHRADVPPPPDGPEPVEVADPGLDDETIARTAEQLSQIIMEGAPA